MADPVEEPTPEQVQHWKQFGAWLESRWLRADMTATDVARTAPASFQTVVNLRDGGRWHRNRWQVVNPQDAVLRRIAKAVGIGEQEVFERAGGDFRTRNGGRVARAADPQARTRRALADARRRVQELERELAEARREREASQPEGRDGQQRGPAGR